MSWFRSALAGFLIAVAFAFAPTLSEAAPADLHLVARIELPGIRGRLDHLAYAPDTNLLFVAGLGANTVQIVHLAASHAAAQLPASEPQGVVYSAALHRLYVANGEAGTVEAFEGSTRVATARDLPDADNVRLDAGSGVLYVGYGHALAALDLHSLAVAQRFPLPGHPEAFELSGSRIFVNVPTAAAVVVLDRKTGTTVHTWTIAPADANFPMAVDASAHRLFVATRRPTELLVLDSESGRRIADLPICADADDLILDPGGRLYAICGDGHIHVIRASGPERYQVEQSIATAPGARTGLLVPELGRLFVAAPARDGRGAAVLVLETR